MSIRIFSKKAFQFGTGANRSGDIECFVTVPGTFQNMPEKYMNDKTFKLAVKTGSVSIIDSTAKQKVAENTVVTSADDVDPAKQYYDKLKTMDRESTIEEAKQYGLSIEDGEKLGTFKKRILEAYKLTLEEEE